MKLLAGFETWRAVGRRCRATTLAVACCAWAAAFVGCGDGAEPVSGVTGPGDTGSADVGGQPDVGTLDSAAAVDTSGCTSAADCDDDGDLCNGVASCVDGACVTPASSVVTCDTSADDVCGVARCAPGTGVCSRVARNTHAACEDGDPCTVGDRCEAGKCASGSASLCDCADTADCADKNDADLCNGSLFCDKSSFPFRCVLNPGTVVTCPPPQDACLAASCDPKTGACVATPLADASPCDDGDPCTLGDGCKAGACQAGPDNTCTCATTADCAKQEDGNLCNGLLYCDQSQQPPVCKVNPGTVVVCQQDSANPCTVGQCQPATGLCQQVAAPPKTPCDDDDACTGGDFCLGGSCQAGTFLCACTKDSDCADKDDGDQCNGLPYCDQSTGKCATNPATVVTCPTVDDTACAKNVCLPKEGTCTQLPRAQVSSKCAGADCAWVPKKAGEKGDAGPFVCDDGNVCTVGDVCEGKVCKSAATVCQCATNADCAKEDDGDLCNGVYYCDKSVGGKCVFNPASKVYCSPLGDSPCLKNTCDPKTGSCGLQPSKGGLSCDDGDLCTTQTTCDGEGGCTGKAVDCDDGDLCTLDACKPAAGCVHGASTCDDANQCTVDSCDSKTGKCSFNAAKKVGQVCNGDNSGCTVNDSCDAQGNCKIGPTALCTQKVGQCQQAACTPQGPTSFNCVVLPAPNGTECDDDDPCTLASECTQGTCDGSQHESFYIRRWQAGTLTQPPQPGLQSLFTDLKVLSDGSAVAVGEAWTGKAGDPKSERSGWLVRVAADGSIASSGLMKPPFPDPHFHVPALGVHSGTLVGALTDVALPGKTRTAVLFRGDVAAGSSWYTVIGDDKVDERARGIAALPDGSAIWVGDAASGTGRQGFIGRSDVAGALVWRKAIPSKTSAVPLGFTRVGNTTVGVGWRGKVGSRKGWAFSHNAAGNLLWQRDVVAKGDAVLRSVAPGPEGGALAAGALFNDGKPVNWLAGLDRAGLPAGNVVGVLKGSFNAIVSRPDGRAAVAGQLDSETNPGRMWLTVGDMRGNGIWGRNPAPLPGHVESAAAIGLLPNGQVLVAGSSVSSTDGSTSGVLARMDPWGHDNCESAGVCGAKTPKDCDDGKACNADLCDGKKGCVYVQSNLLSCDPGDGCHLVGQCSSGSCKVTPSTRFFAVTAPLAGVTAISGLALLPDGGVAFAGTGGKASNMAVRTARDGTPLFAAVQPVLVFPTVKGLGAVGVAPVGGDIGVLGHVNSGLSYPRASLRRIDAVGDAVWTWKPAVSGKTWGDDVVGASLGAPLRVAWRDTSLHVEGVGHAGQSAWAAVKVSSSAELTSAGHLAVGPTGELLVAASTGGDQGRAVRIALVSAAGKLAMNGLVSAKAPVQVRGAALTASGAVVSGRALVAANTWRPWAMVVSATGQVLLEQISPTGTQWSSVAAGPTGVMVVDAVGGALGLTALGPTGALSWSRSYNAAPASMALPTRRALQVAADGSFALAGVINQGGTLSGRLIRGDPWGNAGCAETGTCAEKPATSCVDTNPCTLDICTAKTGCAHPAAPDGLACAVGKVCKAGVCGG